jgi:hypothetical protein
LINKSGRETDINIGNEDRFEIMEVVKYFRVTNHVIKGTPIANILGLQAVLILKKGN